jgi:hypothetical protein
MEVSGQLHASAALPLGNKPFLCVDRMCGVGSRADLDLGEEKNLLSLLVIEA